MIIPITQTKAWQKLQDDLGEKSYWEERDNYQYLAIHKTGKMSNYLYLPYGPATGNKKSFLSALDSLNKLAGNNGAFFIRIEPWDSKTKDYLPKNAVKSQNLNPEETWILDLSVSEADLTAKLPSRLLRYYKNMSKKGIKIKSSHNPDDIKHLTKLQNELAKDKGINTYSEKYLKTELKQPFATLYYATFQENEKDEEQIIAAGLVFDDEKTRYNLQGAQNDLGRKLHATGILTIQLILDAKEKGLSTFDFWGIAPINAPKNHPWLGFTNFKKSFAGVALEHAGTYDIVLDRRKYRIYQSMRRINRFIRRNI